LRDNPAIPDVGIQQERVMATYLKAPIHPSKSASAIVTALSLCGLFIPVWAKASDSVERWNIAMTDYAAAQPPPGIPPMVEARAFAMAHIAVLDALRTARASTAPANVDAAIAAAAHDVLISAFAPFGPNSFDSVYHSELDGIPNGAAETRGVSIGQQAAAAMLASRADENIFAALGAPYTPGTEPGDYQVTPPVGIVAGAGWSTLRTFVVRSSKQFRAPRPYASLRSLDYTMDVNEIELLGKADGSGRTLDQTAIAFYWYENSSFAWNRIARKVAGELSLREHARLFAALNAAISDAYMTSLESKFYYNFWRPITAIRAADSDGNPLTEADETWEPAFITPPVPDYPSAHSAAGGAAAEVIDAFVGRGRPFMHVSTTGPISGVSGAETRSFSSVQKAAVENAYSRMLVGIHFRRACTAGLKQGREIGRFVVEHAVFLRN
jgi:hypothetical protein